MFRDIGEAILMLLGLLVLEPWFFYEQFVASYQLASYR
jgi:hypothetical protein